MPDGSTFPAANRDHLASAYGDASTLDLMRRLAALGQQENEDASNGVLTSIDTRLASEKEWDALRDAALASTPRTLADAAALLFVSSHDLGDAVSEAASWAISVPSYLAIGRVLRFLLTASDLTLEEIGGQFMSHSVDGLTDSARIDLWIDKAARLGCQFILRGDRLAIYWPVDETDKGEQFAALMREFGNFPRDDVVGILRNYAVEVRASGVGFADAVKGDWLIRRAETPPFFGLKLQFERLPEQGDAA